MAVEVFGLQPQRAERFWDSILGMVAKDQQARAEVPLDATIGLGGQVLLKKSIQTSLPRPASLASPSLAHPARLGQEKSFEAAQVATQLPMIFGVSFKRANRLYNQRPW